MYSVIRRVVVIARLHSPNFFKVIDTKKNDRNGKYTGQSLPADLCGSSSEHTHNSHIMSLWFKNHS